MHLVHLEKYERPDPTKEHLLYGEYLTLDHFTEEEAKIYLDLWKRIFVLRCPDFTIVEEERISKDAWKWEATTEIPEHGGPAARAIKIKVKNPHYNPDYGLQS